MFVPFFLLPAPRLGCIAALFGYSRKRAQLNVRHSCQLTLAIQQRSSLDQFLESLARCSLVKVDQHPSRQSVVKTKSYLPSIMLRALSHEPNDIEWNAANHEQTPDAHAQAQAPLELETSNNKRKRQSHCFCAPQMFGGGIYLPDPSTYDPIEILLNTYDRSERDELVKIWRDNKLSELNFVGVVVCTTDIVRITALTTV